MQYCVAMAPLGQSIAHNVDVMILFCTKKQLLKDTVKSYLRDSSSPP